MAARRLGQPVLPPWSRSLATTGSVEPRSVESMPLEAISSVAVEARDLDRKLFAIDVGYNTELEFQGIKDGNHLKGKWAAILALGHRAWIHKRVSRLEDNLALSCHAVPL